MLLVNPGQWRKLPDDIRAELEAIIAEVTSEVNQIATQVNQRDRARILESGRSQILQPTEGELSAWRAVMRPVWDEFAHEIGTEIMAETPAGSIH